LLWVGSEFIQGTTAAGTPQHQGKGTYITSSIKAVTQQGNKAKQTKTYTNPSYIITTLSRLE